MATRPITDTLRLLQGGMFLDQCSEELATLVRGVENSGCRTRHARTVLNWPLRSRGT